MTIEAMRTASALEELGVSIHVVDLRTLKPLDVPFLVREVEKTGKAVIADSGPSFANFGKEIAYQINRAMFGGLEHWPIVVSGRDAHEPTSHGVIGEFKVSASDIAIAVFSALNREPDVKVLQKLKLEKWDVPNEEFTGPF
jgi:pyruvate dehydrogenase E1 component beta subunit